MSRHLGTGGRLATFDGYCVRCDRPIVKAVSQVVHRAAGRWIHAERHPHALAGALICLAVIVGILLGGGR